MKIKYLKIVMSINLLIIFIVMIYVTKVEAHTTNLGVSSYNGITYDTCIPYNSDMPDAGNSDGEAWYAFVSEQDGEKIMQHIDDDVQTIYYKINDTNPNDSEANWTLSPELYKAFMKIGIDTWNCISVYKTNEEGYLYPARLVNFVDIDTLEDPSEVVPNINIYPVSGGRDVTGGCNPVFESEVASDTQTINGVKHIHCTEYNIFVHPDVIGNSYDLLFSTLSHELGHVLGLVDIDSEEYPLFEKYHHQEILMGYANGKDGKQRNITYRDLAGVMITRGLHTDEDHQWMYDEASSSEGSHKLICSLCNCVKYVYNLEDYEYVKYQKCMDNCSYDEAHTLESGNMIPVARYLNKDYWKCKYCRYVAWYDDRQQQQYEYTGICDVNTHVVENHVEGLEYTIREEHNFSVELENGIYKCNSCPMCSNGQIYDDDITLCTLECTTEDIYYNETIEADQSIIYKLDVKCKNTYLIRTNGSSEATIEMFDSNFQKMSNIPIEVASDKTKTIIKLLDIGVYYVRVRFKSYTDTGEINFIVESRDDCYNTPINDGEEISILTHHHNGYTEFEYNNLESGFIRLLLNVTSNNETITYPIQAITIKDSSGNIVQKFTSNIYTHLASSDDEQNCMYIYLDEIDKYLIEVEYPVSEVIDVKLSLERVDDLTFNSYNIFTSEEYDICVDSSSKNDIIYQFATLQNSKYQIDISFDGNANVDKEILFVIISKSVTSNYTIVAERTLTSNETYTIRLDLLNTKKYYIGYFGNNIEGNVNISLDKYLTSHTASIITDPDSLTNCGTEVTMNNGGYRGNHITQGFTRICYILNDVQSNSRLDYYWYVSNENVASVSDYGTVRALGIRTSYTIEVAAIYKNDMSIVIKKTFYLDVDTVGLGISYIYDLTLSMSETALIQSYDDWPSLSRQHYTWESMDESILTVSSWGKITPVSIGTTYIYGEYIYNDKFRISIKVTIV